MILLSSDLSSPADTQVHSVLSAEIDYRKLINKNIQSSIVKELQRKYYSIMGDSFFDPYYQTCQNILKQTLRMFGSPASKMWNKFFELKYATLYFRGFFPIFALVIAAYFVTFISVMLSEIVIMVMLRLIIGLVFVATGVVPTVIVTLDVTSIAIRKLPRNLYIYSLVIYRTVMLDVSLKVLCSLLLPFIILLTPFVAITVSFLYHSIFFSWKSFRGSLFHCWKEDIEKAHNVAWYRISTKVEEFGQNYGHATGIPQNWDGRVFGGRIDAIKIIISIIMYCVTVVPLSISIFCLFIVKAIPIFLFTMVLSWQILGSKDLILNYIDKIVNKMKEETIQNVSKSMTRYFQTIKLFNPAKLCTIIRSYFEELSPRNMFPEKLDSSIVILFIPILAYFVIWIFGLLMVVTIPPISFIILFGLWIMIWPLVILFHPTKYIVTLGLTIFGYPLLYILAWTLALAGPWLLTLLGCLSGPLLTLKVHTVLRERIHFSTIGKFYFLQYQS